MIFQRRNKRRQFGPESSKRSYFYYSQYIVKADECIDRKSMVSIWNPLSRLGAVFRNRFWVPCEVFNCLCREYSSEADTRLKSDNKKGQQSYDCCILVLTTMQVLARDVHIDSLQQRQLDSLVALAA